MAGRGEKADALYGGGFWSRAGIKAYDTDPHLGYPVTVLPDAIHTTSTEKLALIALRGTPRVRDYFKHEPPTFDPTFDPARPKDADLCWCSSCSARRGWLHASAFGIDGSRSKVGKVRYRRYCKACEAQMKRETRASWKNGYHSPYISSVVPLLQ